MLVKSMDEAPHNGQTLVVLTAREAHRAHWDDDPRFQNFWSKTASRALGDEEALGWVSESDWKQFVLQLVSQLPSSATHTES